jgi:glycosyltransferase involved in cell wall biosynthesis
MKILHAISQYPDSTGSGIYLQAILREAHKRGHINGLIAAANTSRKPQVASALDHFNLVEFGESPLDFNLPGMSDVMPYSSTKFKELNEDQLKCYESAFLQRIGQLIEDFSPEIIHSHHLWLLSSFIKKKYPHIPLITNCHGSDLRQFRLCSHLREFVIEGCCSINKVLALTESQRYEIIDLYGIAEENIDIVGAGFDDTLFYWAPKPTTPPVVITYCGKLSRAKGVPWLLKALSTSSIINYELHLIGEGSGQDKVECVELAKALDHRVKFHGNLQQDALADHLRKSHIFILPSLYEGLPLTVLEALACGCRVITTKLPGCVEIYNTIGSDLIHMIDLPRLLETDIPYRQDEADFIKNIRHQLEIVCHLSNLQPSVDKDLIQRKIQPYTWQMVFSRIEKCYSDIHS